MDSLTVPGDDADEIARDVASIGRIEAVPTLLDVLCESTGMRFAAVARVTEGTWTACAVKDTINFGVPVGGRLPVEKTLCLTVKHLNEPIAIDNADVDSRYCDHPARAAHTIKSYVSVPIVLNDGSYFGSLCAIDPAPADVNNARVIGIFTRFAALIALALHNQEMRDRDLASLGHDLSNPLQALSASSEMLLRKPDDAALVRQLAGRIKGNVKRLSVLINDVLDFARSQLGSGIGITVDDTDGVGAGLQQVVKELQDAHSNRQILADIRVTRSVRCDLRRVQQVASHLIAHALKHDATDKPVKVDAHTDEKNLVFAVRNDGEWISAEDASKMFEPFSRTFASAPHDGAGLGLYICAQIVRAHNGDLTVSSSPEHGTQFTACLPLR